MMARCRVFFLVGLLLGSVQEAAWALPVDTIQSKLQNAAVANGNGTTLVTQGYVTATFQIIGTFSATVNFEATQDNATWVSFGCVPVVGVVIAPAGTATTPGLYQCNIAGLYAIRARISGWASGSVTVWVVATTQSQVGIQNAGAVAALPLGVVQGGTGLTSYVIGDLLTASATTTLARLADVATGQVLVSGGVGVIPAWSATPSLTSLTLSTALGGTSGGTGSANTNFILGNLAGAPTPSTGHTWWFHPTNNVLYGDDGTGWQSDVALATGYLNFTDPRWGTCTTDYSSCIQAALTYSQGLAATQSVTVLCSPGIYTINSTLTFGGNDGGGFVGNGCILKAGTVGMTMFKLGKNTAPTNFVNNFRMAGIRFDCNSAGKAATALSIQNVHTSSFRDIYVKNCSGDAIDIQDEIYSLDLINVQVTGSNRALHVHNVQSAITEKINCYNCNLTDSTVENVLLETASTVQFFGGAIERGTRGIGITLNSRAVGMYGTKFEQNSTADIDVFKDAANSTSTGIAGLTVIGGRFHGVGASSPYAIQIKGGKEVLIANIFSDAHNTGTLNFDNTGLTNEINGNITLLQTGGMQDSTVLAKSDGLTSGLGANGPELTYSLGATRSGIRAEETSVAGNVGTLFANSTVGPGLVGNTDSANNSTRNIAAGRVTVGSTGVIISTSPATAVGAARTWTDVLTMSQGLGAMLGAATGGVPAAGALNIAATDGYLVNNIALKNITETLSNKTLASPTLSGTVAGQPTWASSQTFPSLTVVNSTSADTYFQVGGAAAGSNAWYLDSGGTGAVNAPAGGFALRGNSINVISVTSAGAVNLAGTLNTVGAYYSNGTIGVTCAGINAATFTSTLGIVTHC